MIIIPNDIVFDEVERRIANGEKVSLPLKGASMKPTLNEGDIVTLSPVGDCKAFDRSSVLLFRCGNSYVIHRFLYYDGDLLVMRGDNMRVSERIKIDDVVAELFCVEKTVGIIYCKSIIWKIVTLLLPLTRIIRLLKIGVRKYFVA